MVTRARQTTISGTTALKHLSCVFLAHQTGFEHQDLSGSPLESFLLDFATTKGSVCKLTD